MELKQTQPLYQQVYNQFKKLILTGEFPPGSKLSVSKLAEQYQISRTPLREAFRQLQKEGLVIQDQQGTRVVNLNKKDFDHLCSCRLLLEIGIIKQAVEEMTDDEIEHAEELLRKSEESLFGDPDLKGFLELNTQFHETIIHSISNKHLINLLDQVRTLLVLYRANIINHINNQMDIVREHTSILNAIKKRDVSQAVQSIETHLQNDQIRGGELFKE